MQDQNKIGIAKVTLGVRDNGTILHFPTVTTIELVFFSLSTNFPRKLTTD